MERLPADLVVLFGPPAVGKTAVGKEFSALTDFKLYHGHMTMDVLTEFFSYSSPGFMRLHRMITFQILEEAAEQRVSLVLTTGWSFDDPIQTAFNIAVGEPFLNRGGKVHYVELWAPLAVRLERNRTPERLATKKTDWATEDYLRAQEQAGERNSHGALPLSLDFLRLETEAMDANTAARRIRDYITRAS